MEASTKNDVEDQLYKNHLKPGTLFEQDDPWNLEVVIDPVAV